MPMFGWTSFGKVKFNDDIYTTDIYVDTEMNVHERNTFMPEERFGTSHEICADELLEILTEDCEALVIGTGQQGIAKLTRDAYDLVAQRQLELHMYESPKAISVYNEICNKKKTVALIHVTC
jgi:hypothetical protein